ncbi:hypothetical protein GE061_012097 [Apolygus lucorum]|uniref:Uncharacterized protein n=1 Tax=Apolygus lucorum TaxID=248454 RepID=A0A8S9XSI5_APOLU|nr:hypothetical protein GE061_012097 [Apolygus lucorum]
MSYYDWRALRWNCNQPRYYSQPQPYDQRVADGYRGGQQGYRNFAGEDARTKEIIRDSAGLEGRDSDGHHGGHYLARGKEAAERRSGDAFAAIYDGTGRDASVAAAKYGAAGQGGYGGYGAEGHDKGHSTSGFHKTYHNMESGKNTNFVDEDHHVADQHAGRAQDAALAHRGFGVRGGGFDGRMSGGRVAQDARASDAGAVAAKYGAHDANGYYHNQDLALQRGQVLAEENRLANQGRHGMRADSGAARFRELW